jgi:DNA-binding transcriptional regulator YdaS (Cro superfamily)
MELHTWLDKPKNKGKTTWLADQLGLTKSAVSQWRANGVPMPYMMAIEQLTGGAVKQGAMLKHKLQRTTVRALR